MSQRPLENHRSLIVGGAGGIGRASARAILADGAHVTIAGRTPSKLEAFAAELEPLARESGGSNPPSCCWEPWP